MKTTFTLFLAFAIALPTQAGEKPRPQIIGHRGLIKHAPENTFAGFAACIDLRLGFEVDVRRDKEGHLICLHDATVDRTTNGKGKAVELSPDELRNLDAGRRFHPDFVAEPIPRLRHILDRLATKPVGLAALDIKEEDLEESIIAMVGERLAQRVVCIGLTIESPTIRKKLRAGDPTIGIAVLAQTAKDLPAALEDPSANWIYVRFVPGAEQVAQVHKQGKKVFIAGVTVAGMEPENWRRCREAGVDAVLTDYPLECRQALK